MLQKSKLKVLFVSSEVSPYAKTGGLADVAGSLPVALAEKGHDVRIVMPRYKKIAEQLKYTADFPITMNWRKETCILREHEMSLENTKVKVYFTDNYQYFDREHMYCYFDEAERFAFFAKAVLEMLKVIDFKPDVIHCNDWQSGPICALLKERYKSDEFYSKIATVFTVHNLQYQGNYPGDTIKLFGLDETYFTTEKLEFYGTFSFMKAGLNYADIINTVSETYAKEIQTPEYGERFEGLLKQRSKELYGIVNGISYDEFNPATDPKIYKNFDKDSLDNKKNNKTELQKEMGLPKSDAPLIGLISRLVNQKGLDLISEAMEQILKNDMQFVLLGSGDEYYETLFKNYAKKYPKNVAAFIGFNSGLAQKIYASSDMFLMPSKFEPCGLGQIFSLRYGTIPIVRATGGLADTVIDCELNKEGNGFSFKEYSSKELIKTINRAIKFYNTKPEEWKQLVVRALEQDFSWKRSADKYIEIYNKAVLKKN